uniref:Protein kinase domain-containing protein n=1 Tax=Palpitomonas bilix TaxID=652834 RepID=A0A7S3DMP8_9EUKA|mmetsp:Transcript_42936/g.110864  ORF Transcript_42936/g.110864 Transcript_42936/m.110864 type:complete len:784 (+) Transcript_42936:191-2542(+)
MSESIPIGAGATAGQSRNKTAIADSTCRAAASESQSHIEETLSKERGEALPEADLGRDGAKAEAVSDAVKKDLDDDKAREEATGSSAFSSDEDLPPLDESEQHLFDSSGHIVFEKGLLVGGRYEMSAFLGRGTFGTVAKAWDTKEKHYCALKIVRRGKTYNHTSSHELQYYVELQRRTVMGKSRIHPRVLGSFLWHDTLCIVFELLGPDLHKVIGENGPLPLSFVKDLAYNILCALRVIHEVMLIHADLKPENILFFDTDWGTERATSHLPRPDVCLVDFGGALFEYESHPDTITTRPYRAPEVSLKLDWSYPVDLWAVGCILVEAVSGWQVFKSGDDIERVAMYYKAIGPPPIEMVYDSMYAGSNLFEHGQLRWPQDCTLPTTVLKISNMMSIAELLPHMEEREAEEMGITGRCVSQDLCSTPFHSTLFFGRNGRKKRKLHLSSAHDSSEGGEQLRGGEGGEKGEGEGGEGKRRRWDGGRGNSREGEGEAGKCCDECKVRNAKKHVLGVSKAGVYDERHFHKDFMQKSSVDEGKLAKSGRGEGGVGEEESEGVRQEEVSSRPARDGEEESGREGDVSASESGDRKGKEGRLGGAEKKGEESETSRGEKGGGRESEREMKTKEGGSSDGHAECGDADDDDDNDGNEGSDKEEDGEKEQEGACAICKAYHAKDWILFRDLVSRLLTWKGEGRISAEQALSHPFFQEVNERHKFWSNHEGDGASALSVNDGRLAWSWRSAGGWPLEDDEREELEMRGEGKGGKEEEKGAMAAIALHGIPDMTGEQ